MADYIIEVEGVAYSYPNGTWALRDINMCIPRGKKIALLGSNGAGKSTLFLHFNGILKPHKGIVRFNGEKIKYNRQTLLELCKNVGIVFQDPDSQLFSASVFQEISFGPLNLGLSEETVRERVEGAMSATGITDLKEKPTHMLSYGQKKRVSIADILAMEPQVLVCDEPTAWLDPKHAKQTVQLFNNINQQGTTIIMSTHDVDLAYTWADYIFVMGSGAIIGEGEPTKVFCDDILVRKADLERPWIIDVYDSLLKKGSISADTLIPRNKGELLELILNHCICGGEKDNNDNGIFGNERRERNILNAVLKGF